ncbi:hypothetical protein P9209_12525 [Prescottella defluvii]|nr:hypothetical protein P9209_12525 [Prescottella defluvii]
MTTLVISGRIVAIIMNARAFADSPAMMYASGTAITIEAIVWMNAIRSDRSDAPRETDDPKNLAKLSSVNPEESVVKLARSVLATGITNAIRSSAISGSTNSQGSTERLFIV